MSSEMGINYIDLDLFATPPTPPTTHAPVAVAVAETVETETASADQPTEVETPAIAKTPVQTAVVDIPVVTESVREAKQKPAPAPEDPDKGLKEQLRSLLPDIEKEPREWDQCTRQVLLLVKDNRAIVLVRTHDDLPLVSAAPDITGADLGEIVRSALTKLEAEFPNRRARWEQTQAHKAATEERKRQQREKDEAERKARADAAKDAKPPKAKPPSRPKKPPKPTVQDKLGKISQGVATYSGPSAANITADDFVNSITVATGPTSQEGQ